MAKTLSQSESALMVKNDIIPGKIIGFYEFTRLIVSVTYKTLFSSRYKFLLVRYLKKNY